MRHRALVLVLILALVLRGVGSAFGAPAAVHPDEAQYMPTALGMAASRTLLPADYHNPHFFTNLCLLILGASAVLLRALGVTPTVDAFKTFVWSHTFLFLLLARWLSVVAGTGTVLIAYRISMRLGSARAALYAAGLLAVSFLHVRDSHFATNDVLTTALIAAAVLQALRYLDASSDRSLALAAAFAGFATGAKYNGGIAIVSVLAAMALNVLQDRRAPAVVLRRLAICAGASITAFIMSNPAALVDPKRVINGFVTMIAIGHERWLDQDLRPVPFLMLKTTLLGCGTGVTACALWGLRPLANGSGRKALVTFASPLAYILFMMRSEGFGARLMLPVVPFVAVLGGIGLDAIVLWFQRHELWSYRRFVAIAIVAVVMAEPISRSMYLDLLLTRRDNRRDVEAWLLARPDVLKRAVIDSRAAAGFANTLPAADVVVPARLVSTKHLADVLPPGERYVVLSHLTTSSKSNPVERVCEEEGVLLAEFSPYRATGPAPTADDILSPFDDIFAWRQPGLLVRVFDLGATGYHR